MTKEQARVSLVEILDEVHYGHYSQEDLDRQVAAVIANVEVVMEAAGWVIREASHRDPDTARLAWRRVET